MGRIGLAVTLCVFSLALETSAFEEPHMAGQNTTPKTKILVHVTHGPEQPTRAALAFLVAKSALDKGHIVTIFLAGDAVQLIRDAVLDNLTWS